MDGFSGARQTSTVFDVKRDLGIRWLPPTESLPGGSAAKLLSRTVHVMARHSFSSYSPKPPSGRSPQRPLGLLFDSIQATQ